MTPLGHQHTKCPEPSHTGQVLRVTSDTSTSRYTFPALMAENTFFSFKNYKQQIDKVHIIIRENYLGAGKEMRWTLAFFQLFIISDNSYNFEGCMYFSKTLISI